MVQNSVQKDAQQAKEVVHPEVSSKGTDTSDRFLLSDSFLSDKEAVFFSRVREKVNHKSWLDAWEILSPRVKELSLQSVQVSTFTEEERYGWIYLFWFAARVQEGLAQSGLVQDAGKSQELESLYWSKLGAFDHILENWGKLFLAKSLLKDKPQEAMVILKQLPKYWAGQFERWLCLIKILETLGRSKEALSEIEQGFKNYKNVPKAIRWNVSLIKAQILLSKDKNYGKVTPILDELVVEQPPFSVLRQIHEMREKAEHPKEKSRSKRKSNQELKFEIEKGKFLFQTKRYVSALKVFDEVLKSARKYSQWSCEALLMKGKIWARKRKRKKASEAFAKIDAHCKQKNVRVKTKYNFARTLSSAGKFKKAMMVYDGLIEEFPHHRLADDALFRSAKCAFELDKPEEGKSRFEKLLKRFPNGDMFSETVFRLAWIAKERGDFKKALMYFEQLFQKGEKVFEEGKQGRALYWKGRMHSALQQYDQALENYVQLFRTWPLSYYSQQALVRVSEISSVKADLLRRELSVNDKLPNILLSYKDVLKEEGVARLVLLVQLGEESLVKKELDYSDFPSFGSKKDLWWFVVTAMNQSESFYSANKRVRTSLRSFFKDPPSKEAYFLWKQAYPEAFGSIVVSAAKEFSIPCSFLWAVAREESWFNPRAVSIANAYGLIQMLPSTAQKYAEPLGLAYDADTLMVPESNLRVGASFMKDLRDRYALNPAIVPAAYNAGPGAVDRWLRTRGDFDLDEWIETIPFDETRRYTRRVLQSWGIYFWLESNRFLNLKKTLPPPYRKNK